MTFYKNQQESPKSHILIYIHPAYPAIADGGVQITTARCHNIIILHLKFPQPHSRNLCSKLTADGVKSQ